MVWINEGSRSGPAPYPAPVMPTEGSEGLEMKSEFWVVMSKMAGGTGDRGQRGSCGVPLEMEGGGSRRLSLCFLLADCGPPPSLLRVPVGALAPCGPASHPSGLSLPFPLSCHRTALVFQEGVGRHGNSDTSAVP